MSSTHAAMPSTASTNEDPRAQTQGNAEGEATPREVPRLAYREALRLLRDPYRFFRDAPAKHGDLFTVDLGLTQVIVAHHPDHIDHVLRKNAGNYPKEGSMWDGLRALLGNGLIVSQGAQWRKQRRMMQPHFHQRRLAGLTDLMAETIEEVVETWRSRTDAPVDMRALCPHMTMGVIVRAIFGTEVDEEEVRAVGDALAYALDYILRGMALQALPAWLPMPGRGRYERALKSIDEIVYRLIRRKRQSGVLGDDLLSMMLSMVDEESGEGMSDEELHDEVVNLFLAGYETTATGMAWAFELLARRPEIAARAREEVRRVVGDRRPGYSDLPELRYCRQIVQEAFRLYTPAWQIMRSAVEEDRIDGYRIPKGAQIMLSFVGSHRHPAYWPEPDRFDPERFSTEASRARPKEAWMPFGAGQRQCIGKELSLMESTLILAIVLQRFRLAPVAGRPAKPKLSLVLTAEEGIWLHLDPVERDPIQRDPIGGAGDAQRSS